MVYSGDTMAREQTESDMATINKQMGSMLTVRKVSKPLHVHSNTLRRWTGQGIVKAYRIGPRGDRRFRAEDIAVLLLEKNKGIRLDAGKGNQVPDTTLAGGLCGR